MKKKKKNEKKTNFEIFLIKSKLESHQSNRYSPSIQSYPVIHVYVQKLFPVK